MGDLSWVTYGCTHNASYVKWAPGPTRQHKYLRANAWQELPITVQGTKCDRTRAQPRRGALLSQGSRQKLHERLTKLQVTSMSVLSLLCCYCTHVWDQCKGNIILMHQKSRRYCYKHQTQDECKIMMSHVMRC